MKNPYNKQEIKNCSKILGMEKVNLLEEFFSVINLITINQNLSWIRRINLGTKKISYQNTENLIFSDYPPLFPKPDERKFLFTKKPELKVLDIKNFMSN